MLLRIAPPKPADCCNFLPTMCTHEIFGMIYPQVVYYQNLKLFENQALVTRVRACF